MITDHPAPPGPPPTARCWTVVGPEGAVDVEVTARDCDRLGQILPVLGRALGVPCDGLWDGPTRLPDDLPLDALALAHGALLGFGRPAPPACRSARSSALELHVLGGPDAGTTLPLVQGRHVLGRGEGATVPLTDPDVSRRHVEVRVGGGRITVADLDSTNGTRLAGEDLDGRPRPWPIGALLRLGTTTVTVAGPGAPGAGLAPGASGRARLRPTPLVLPPVEDVEVSLPRPPQPPPPRRLAWVAVALPAVGGAVMAWVLDAPTFLFFALLSPVVALGNWLSDRWSGRRTGRREAAAHALEQIAAEGRLAAAVQTRRHAAESRHPDLASLTTAARRRGRLLWSRPGTEPGALRVRLGIGIGRTGVTRVEGDGSRHAQTAPDMPVVLDLARDGGLAVIGPREAALGVLRAVLAQLTALHPPGHVHLVLLTETGSLACWAWARWLPHLPPTAVHIRPPGPPAVADDALLRGLGALVAAHRASGGPAPDRSTWTIAVVDRPLDDRLAALLDEARDAGLLVVTSARSEDALPVGVGAVLHLTGETGEAGIVRRRGLPELRTSTVDRLPQAAAARFARDLAGLAPAEAGAALPRSVRLLELPGPGLVVGTGGSPGGVWSRSRDRLQAVLGRTADGPFELDLCRVGPHVLVAGTTGSGKSELLQTLVAGLALAHPPDRCSFLLVDYKGGAAFAEAADLPHTVGVVTDLDSQSTARALRSLSAELSRREAVLAAHRVPDIAALPDSADLARLVIVVDEFATLVDELPSFVPGLVSIAQRGRSLGVHLVLATQRPGGVVSPEIRANCTLRICLRTTDETDSRDVLGTASAAHLPLDIPGRAYVRAGTGAPAEVQIARVAAPPPPAAATEATVHRRAWPGPVVSSSQPTAGPTDLARLTGAIQRHARSTGAAGPHRPWRPPLPERLAATDLPRPPLTVPTRLGIGLLDLPDAQAQEPLELDLAEGGTWLAVGGPRSGRSTLLRTVLREATARLGPDDLHVHVVETTGGSLGGEAAALAHTGTVISGEDRLRTTRLVERLAEEVAARRAGAATDGPRLLLLVDGLEELSTIVEDADPGSGVNTLARLLRDGGAAGLTCVATADRAVPGGRLAGLARHRLVLPLPDRADYALAGVPARSVPERRPAGRALVGEDAVECQLALPRETTTADASTAHGPRPLRIPALPADPAVPLPVPPGPASAPRPVLVVGPGGDSGEPIAMDLARTGGLLVAGPPGSGRTAALDAFARHLAAAGAPVLRLGPDPGRPVGAADGIDGHDEAGLREWLATLDGRTGVVIADDVGAPGDQPALGVLHAASAGPARVALIAAAHAAQLATHYQGAIAGLRRSRAGLLLCPGPGDADLLGVRLPRTPLPRRPGSGWLVQGARIDRVQVARRRESPG